MQVPACPCEVLFPSMQTEGHLINAFFGTFSARCSMQICRARVVMLDMLRACMLGYREVKMLLKWMDEVLDPISSCKSKAL
jgi:hypothetical protein